jgi:glycosyltransferase involved in cell wall biosynthesis
MSRFSIITICLNASDDLRKTLESISRQTCDDIELIIIDGGSVDGSDAVLEEYSSMINCLVSEPDNGIYDAQNKGIDHAGGDYLFFLNAGDILLDDQLFEKLAGMSLEADLVYGNIQVKIKGGVGFLKKMPRKLSKAFMFNDTIPHQSVLIKRELFNRIGKYNLDYPIVADYDYFMRAMYSQKCSGKFIDLVFAEYNMDGTSSKLSNRRQMMLERRRTKRKYLGRFDYIVYSLLMPFYSLFVKYPRFLVKMRRVDPDAE